MPNINPRIRSLDDLLGVARKVENTAATEDKPAQPGNNEIQMLPPEIIRGFRGHPFRLYEGDRFNDLVDSVSENGVLSPTIIRKIEPDENGFEYEMLAGHNRQNAAIAAKRLLPCIVKENLSDQDAWIYVIETNVLQRSFSEMFPSERAAVLALRYSKMICQGRRNDIIEELKRLENPDEIRENKTCGIDCHKSKSRDVVGAEYNLKGRAVANYLRINELSAALKIRIDDGEFTIAAAVQLSYLAQEEQQMVEAVLSESEYKVNEGKAVLLREYTGKLTPERAEQILSGEFNRKPKKSTAAAFKVKPAIYKKYFTASISQKEFDSTIKAKVVDLSGNDPPDPKATDTAGSWRPSDVPSREEKSYAAWSVWWAQWHPYWVWHSTGDGDGYWVDEGWYDFFRDNYSASMTATTRIEPDEKVPTAAGNTMKSGYGVSNTVTATVSTSAPMSHYTYGQTAVSYFPEFNYTTYWRLLDPLSSGKTARFQFAENIYSTYKQRIHFSPVWFPDGSYTVNTHVMDIWTPAGMLCANLTDSVTISGSLYDDWHIAPGNP